MYIKYDYGTIARDKITSKSGIITAAIYHYGYRPTEYVLETTDKTGRPIQFTVDENRIQTLENGGS